MALAFGPVGPQAQVHWAIRHMPERLLPVLMEPCDPYAFHIRIARIQWTDLAEDLVAGRQELIERLTPSDD